MKLIFDIETDGLLDTVTKIHCVVARDVDTDEEYVWVGDKIKDSWNFLNKADTLIGHNIMAFDIPVLEKIFSKKLTQLTLRDTLVLTRLIWPDRRDKDFKLFRSGKLPPKLIGSHSLKAWGYRIGEYKGEFGETTDWQNFSSEMLEYCRQDVKVNVKLFKKIEALAYSEDAIQLEHDLHQILINQEQDGFPFDEKKAQELFITLNERRQAIESELTERQPPWIEETEFIPKVNNKTRGYVKGVPFIKKKEIPFNPNSREHIARMLMEKYGWEPKVFTETGLPKVDEKVLSGLKYPEAELLNEYLMIQKRIGQLAEGEQAWMKLSKNGVIHGRVNHMGAVDNTTKSNCAQILRSMLRMVSVVVYFTLLTIGLLWVAMCLVLNSVCLGILWLSSIMANTLISLSMEISIQPISKPLGWLPATWLKPLSTAGFMERVQRKSAKSLVEAAKKVKLSSESF